MSEFKGTKGEWELQQYHYGELIGLKVVANSEDGDENIIFDTDSRGYIDDETEANAKLIACAPEMLEILDKIIIGYENAGGEMWIPDMIQEHIYTAKKLIKKATE